ncbi:spermidine synthase [Kocuria sp. M1R5S2]|uniref:spermidine synthase n=1 Tax=Kocuria rhizosphaerae TaxID=3376285 RepID=UPI00379DE7C8
MSRSSPRAARRSSGEREPGGPVAGSYEISTGTAELVPDEYAPGSWVLHVNGVPSSHVDPGHPERLDFEYMRWVAALVDAHVAAHLDPSALRVLHLGGGACSLARFLAHAHPSARQVVVELDARLAELVREWFDLPRAPLLRIRVGEARAVTESLTPATRDVVVRDVFAGAVTPEPLTTVEFARHVDRVLAPGGLYVLNCGDTRDLAGARAEAAALSEVFEHVAAVADPAMLKGRRYGNIVLAASHAPLPAEGTPAGATLTHELLGGAVPAQYKDGAWVRSFVAGTPPRRDP